MSFQIGFTGREITPWGGMALMKKMLDQSGVDECMRSLGLLEPESNWGYRNEGVIKSFWVSVWCGANRFSHTEVTRQDEVIRQIFWWKRICVQDKCKRFFRKFTQGIHQRVFTLL